METNPSKDIDRSVLIDHVLDVVTVLDAHGIILYESPSFEQVFDRRIEDVLGTPAFDLIHSDDLPSVHEVFSRILDAPGVTIGAEFRFRHADGSWRFMESRAKNLLDDPALGGILVSSRDITKRVQAERDLQEMRDHLQELVEARTAALEQANARLHQEVEERRVAQAERLQLLNQEREARAAAARSGQHLEFLFRTMSALLVDVLAYRKNLRRLAEAVVPSLADWCTIHIVAEDGTVERLVAVHSEGSVATPTASLPHKHVIDRSAEVGPGHVLQTGKAELYLHVPDMLLEQLAQDEEHLRRLKSLGVTSGMVVPLVARGRTLGILTLARGQSGEPYTAEHLALAEDLARRAGMVIDSARLYEEVQRSNEQLEQRVAKRTEQLEAANQELESFSYSVSHDLRSPLRAIEGFTRILLDSFASELSPKAHDYLHRVQRNALRMGVLIDDLLQFSRLSRQEMQRQTVRTPRLVQQVLEELDSWSEDDQIRIDVEDLPTCEADSQLLKQVYVNLISNAVKFSRNQTPAIVTIGSQQDKGRTVYFVADNGAGFDMRYADKLFGVFQRLHRSDEYEGTGVGLAIVQRIIHRHGGQVWADSAPGKGATFYFTLQPTV